MPWFQFKVRATQIVLVEASCAEIAADLAYSESFDMARCEKDIVRPNDEINESLVESKKQLADIVLQEEE